MVAAFAVLHDAMGSQRFGCGGGDGDDDVDAGAEI